MFLYLDTTKVDTQRFSWKLKTIKVISKIYSMSILLGFWDITMRPLLWATIMVHDCILNSVAMSLSNNCHYHDIHILKVWSDHWSKVAPNEKEWMCLKVIAMALFSLTLMSATLLFGFNKIFDTICLEFKVTVMWAKNI